MQRNGEEVSVDAFETTLGDMPVYLIGGGPIDASSSIYSSKPDIDGEKYTFFSLAALGLIKQLDWHPDVVHANDWHTALTVLWYPGATLAGRAIAPGLARYRAQPSISWA